LFETNGFTEKRSSSHKPTHQQLALIILFFHSSKTTCSKIGHCNFPPSTILDENDIEEDETGENI
jgi:hypothetical protein